MKLLLTSNGLSNQSIAKALFDLVGKAAEETSIVFIPTAMNVDSGEKSWFIDDLLHIKQQSPAFIDIVDISAVSKNIWLPRCQRGDVLFFSGGDTPYLMRCMNESGFVQELPSLLKSRVYAGISAGSMVTGPSLAINNIDRKIYSEDTLAYSNGETLNVNGLHLVNFYIRPHYNSPDFPGARKEQLEE